MVLMAFVLRDPNSALAGAVIGVVLTALVVAGDRFFQGRANEQKRLMDMLDSIEQGVIRNYAIQKARLDRVKSLSLLLKSAPNKEKAWEILWDLVDSGLSLPEQIYPLTDKAVHFPDLRKEVKELQSMLDAYLFTELEGVSFEQKIPLPPHRVVSFEEFSEAYEKTLRSIETERRKIAR